MKLKPIILDSKELVDLTLGYKHIYLISPNVTIKKDDWYYDSIYKTIGQCVFFMGIHDTCTKIACSTDKELNLPQLSEQAIESLVDYHNKKGKMPDEVKVGDTIINVKGTVDVTLTENKLYTKEKVESLCRKAMRQGKVNGVSEQACMDDKIDIEDWIKTFII